ncbi:MAG TPA: hypothetical protein VEK38_01650 [Candidatus Bathyarchaeia archaeon]|nr:hypothetical protein [Candidatus Bathyarchaeia archaeon]
MKLYIKNGLYLCGLICAINMSIAKNRSMTQKEAVLLEQAVKERIKKYEEIIEMSAKVEGNGCKDGYGYKRGKEIVEKITQKELFKAGFLSADFLTVNQHILDVIYDTNNYVGDEDQQRAFWYEKLMAVHDTCEKNDPDKKEFCVECRLIYEAVQQKYAKKMPIVEVSMNLIEIKRS